MKKLLLQVITTLVFISCSKNEVEQNTCVTNNYTIQINRLLKKVKTTHSRNLPTIRNYEYSYNNYNLLEEVYEYTFDVEDIERFVYKCNNNLTEINKNGTDANYVYQYNSENKLTSYKTINSSSYDYSLTYSLNTIKVIGVINSKNTTLHLEINSNGLVTKIHRENSYSTFDYDSNGNLIRVKDFNKNNIIERDYEISYDENPNPFYGQFKSSYLVQFINYFSESAFLGIDVFFRFNQYDFPYLKNNPILLVDKKCTPCYNKLLERTYEYDYKNYPIKIEESYVGDPEVLYEFEYQN